MVRRRTVAVLLLTFCCLPVAWQYDATAGDLPKGRLAFAAQEDAPTLIPSSVAENDIWISAIGDPVPLNLSDDRGVISIEPAWFRDGLAVAWYGGKPGAADIFVGRPGSPIENWTRQVTGDMVSPAPSPDGKSIAFTRVGGEALLLAPYEPGVALSMSDVTTLGIGSWPDFSPDGRRLLYTHWSSAKIGELHVLDLASGQDTLLRATPGYVDCLGRWSPSGDSVVFVSDQTGDEDIWRVSFDANKKPIPGSFTNLTKTPARNESSAVFSPEGDRIAFVGSSSPSGSSTLFVMYRDGTGLESFPGIGNVYGIDWAPSAGMTIPAVGPEVSCPEIDMETGKEGLVLITHGWNGFLGGADHSWIDELRDAIRERLEHDGTAAKWQIVSYHWDEDAAGWSLLPGDVLCRARQHGSQIGDYLYEGEYSQVHLIGHSAGAGLIEAAAERYRSRVERDGAIGHQLALHLTFLDPYTGILNPSLPATYGAGATWADCYYAVDPVPFTDGPLKYAFNRDVTSYAEEGPSHGFPHEFYEDTISGDWSIGFPLSLESGKWSPASHPVGNGYREPRLFSPLTPALDLFDALQSTGGGGEVEVGKSSASMTTGSPVWFVARVESTTRVSGVTFDAAFSSDEDAVGILSVSFDGTLIGSLAQRYYPQEGGHEYIGLPAVADPGVHTISFRLDSPTSAQASVQVSDVRLVGVTDGVLEVRKLKIRVKPGRPGRDSLVMAGQIPWTEETALDGTVVSIDLGGIRRTFTLDARGRARMARDMLKCSRKVKDGRIPFTLKLRRGEFATALLNEDLAGVSDAKKEKRHLMVSVNAGDREVAGTLRLDYRAKAGRSAAAKLAKR